MGCQIRRASPDDAQVIAEFNRRLAWETEAKDLEPSILANGVAAILADSSKGWYFLAEQTGEVLGQLMLTFEWSDWRNGWFWWIQSVYVHQDARHKGIFRSLYEHVVALARAEANVIGLRLYVEKDNLDAQRTYARLGMEPLGYFMLQKYLL